MEDTDMISEKSFARGYSSFWIEYFPWLNSYCQSLNKYNLERVSSPLPELDAAEHRSINNTIAFYHFRNLFNDPNFDICTSRDQAISYMSRFPRSATVSYSFSVMDRQVVETQVSRLKKRYDGNLCISPFFPGCGIIDNCHGDILQGNKLIEIKAGERNIQPADIKQLIVYSALDWLSPSNKYQFDEIEIYNPRVGYLWKNQLEDLLVSITDIPKEDVFEQIGKYLVIQSEDFELG